MSEKNLTTGDVATLEWWTVRECASRWNVSEDTVIRMIDRGEVMARKFGRQWRIHNDEVERLEGKARPRHHAPARPRAVIDRGDPLGLYSSK
jgi:excisionase family DNA binding protein